MNVGRHGFYGDYPQLKRSQELSISTVGKMLGGHLKNWPDSIHYILKGFKE
jgi:hypothetical protein